MLEQTFRSAESINVRQHRALCQKAFQHVFRNQHVPTSEVLCCGLSWLDVRTAISVFAELVPAQQDSRWRQMKQLVEALQLMSAVWPPSFQQGGGGARPLSAVQLLRRAFLCSQGFFFWLKNGALVVPYVHPPPVTLQPPSVTHQPALVALQGVESGV